MTIESCQHCGLQEHLVKVGGHDVCFSCRRATTRWAVDFLFDRDNAGDWWTKSEWPKSNEWTVAEPGRARILDESLQVYLLKLIVK